MATMSAMSTCSRTSTLLIQKAEVDWAFAAGKTPPFKAERPIRKLEGDLDVFGDGSVTIIATPGHTPGHQSLLVHLPKTGWLVLSGDAAHFKDNWDNKRVASMNTSAEQTQASLQEDRRADGRQEGAALDQPRQAAEPGPEALAAILPIDGGAAGR